MESSNAEHTGTIVLSAGILSRVVCKVGKISAKTVALIWEVMTMRLIDADALMRSIEPILEAEEQIYGCSSWCFAIKCRDEVQDAPTVDAVPVRRGKWILQGDSRKALYGWYFCSECGAFIGGKTNFCSECGADMRGERHDVI